MTQRDAPEWGEGTGAQLHYRKGSRREWTVIRRVDGEVDDVAISCDLFRLEKLARGEWWLAAYRGGKRVSFSLSWDAKRRAIVATLVEDELTCKDDTA